MQCFQIFDLMLVQNHLESQKYIVLRADVMQKEGTLLQICASVPSSQTAFKQSKAPDQNM